MLKNNSAAFCQCHINFTLDKDYYRDVFIYYGLTNFYQNHRRYVKSRDDKQLLGLKGTSLEDCKPFNFELTTNVSTGKVEKHPYAPCGAIANSMFNDTIRIRRWDLTRSIKDDKFSYIKLRHEGIAWATDKNAKFKNPPGPTLQQAFAGYRRPPSWSKDVWDLSRNDSNNGYQNEQLIVWMRTAALPTFRKLYARVDHTVDPAYTNGLPKGEYQLEVDYSECDREFLEF